MINITTQLSLSEFIKGSLILAYRRPAYIIIALFAMIMIVINIVLNLSPVIKKAPSIIPEILLLVAIPLIVIFSAIRLYRSNPDYKKVVTYSFTGDYVEVKAENSEGKTSLSTLPKVVKTGSWLYIYRNAHMANMIPLRDFSNEQLIQLKLLLTERNVKNNL